MFLSVRCTPIYTLPEIDPSEHHSLAEASLRAAKTVADCFKYRNKIGLDVAIEALTECLREQRCTIDELLRYAKICRVANVMRPYLEALA